MSKAGNSAARLASKTAEKLVAWAEAIPALQDAHASLGFRMPKVDAALIEGVRPRTPLEKPYGYYLKEVLKEAFFLRNGAWAANLRHDSPVRSEYLDFLQLSLDRGTFGDIGPAHASLDPNYIVYSKLKTRDPTGWLQHLDGIRAAKDLEIVEYSSRFGVLTAVDLALTPKNVVALLLGIAEELQLAQAVVQSGEDPRVVIGAEIIAGISMYLEWSEFAQLKKWGQLQLAFVIQESDKAIWVDPRDRPFSVGLGGIVPGADWYAWNNATLENIAAAFLASAHCLRLSKLTDRRLQH